MSTLAQKSLLDALSQHQAYLYRASSQNVNDLIQVFDKLSNEQLLKLGELFEDLTESERKALQGLNFSSRAKASRNIEEIKATLNEWFFSLNTELPEIFEQSAIALAVYEAGYTVALMGEKLKTYGEKIYQKAKNQPFSGGQLVDSLFADIAANLRKKVEYVIRDGISQGLTNQQIIQKIKGKKSLDYKDGILKSSRESIERQVRTARSHVANVTYEDTYRALGVKELTVCATLDGRTCIRCASLDGQNFAIDDLKKPKFPEHPHSRTVYMPKVDNISGVRPFVADERKVKDIPKGQRDGKIGQVDANTSFKEWFAKQGESFQEEWLGPSRFQLYKNGQYSIDKFIDPQGRKYTLDELKKLDEQSFNTVFKATQSGKQFKQPFNEPSVYDLPKHVHKPDISTPTKKIAVKYEDEFRDAKKEYGVFIDGDGKTILTLSGDVNSVNVPRGYWNAVKNSTFTHNHPEGSNFSIQDIISAGDFDLEEVRAVTANFRFSMQKVEGSKWASKAELYEALSEFNEQARGLTRNLTNTDQIHLKYAQEEMEHQLWILITQKFGLKYKRERS